NMSLEYTGGSTMTLDIDGTTQATLSSIPSEFGTAPATAYWGTSYDGASEGDQADATYDNLGQFELEDSASFYFDSSTGGNHETQTANAGSSEASTVAIAEDTSAHNYTITVDSSDVTMDIDGTTATHSTQVPNSAQYLRFESTDDTNTLSLDHVFVRKLADTAPSADAAGSEETTPGPVAEWKFDEGEGTTAHDSTENGNDGTISGATWQDESMCISGECLYFDGTDDKVDSFSTSQNAQTISFWIRPISTTDSFIDLTGSIYVNASSGTVTGTGFTSPTVYVNGETSSTITANTWQFVTITTETAFDANAIVIGLANSDYFKGYLDEIKIYPYARSASQILNDYAKGSASAGSNAVLGANSFGGTNTASLSDGLVGYWKMDDDSWADSSGNGNDGTGYNGVTTAAGKFGDGGSFDGVDDYVEIGDTDVLSFGNGSIDTAFSISTWIKMDNAAQFRLPSKYGTSSGQEYGLFTNASGKLGFYLYDSSSYIGILTTEALTSYEGSWTHVSAKYDGTQTSSAMSLYINGKQATTEESNSGTYIAMSNTSSPFLMGKYYTSYGNGSIDEVRIYNRALSPAEVRALYEYAPGPVAHWKFDDGTGTEAADSSGNGNTGTLTNGPTWTAGKYGKALSFDGTDDYVTKGYTENLKLGNNGTIEAWVNPINTSNNTHSIVSYGNVSGYTTGYLLNQYGTSLSLYWKTGSPIATVSNFFSKNTWTHLAVKNSAGNLEIFKDGILVATADSGGEITDDHATYIGGAVSNYFSEALIDDVRIYNYARSQKQIIEDMNAGHPAGGSPVGSQVGYWKFDEGYGDTANDSSIHGNNGDLGGSGEDCSDGGTGCPSWSNEGRFGKALDFNSSETDNVSIGDLGTNIGSVCFWTNLDSTTEKIIDLDGGTHYIQASSGTVTGEGFSSPTVYLNGKEGSTIDTNWNHICITTATSFDANAVTVGKVGSDYLDGMVDELKIYSYELSEDEVRVEYNRGKALVLGAQGTDPSDGSTSSNSDLSKYCVPGDTSTCRAPVGEWLFDEGTGTTAYDSSGNGNDGTLTNGPVWSAGKVGKGLSFDGSDDYVESDSPGIIGTGELTVSTWFSTTNTTASHANTLISWGAAQDGEGLEINVENGTIWVRNWLNTAYAGENYNDGKWHHVSVKKEADTTIAGWEIFVDGEKLETTTSGSDTISLGNTYTVAIGDTYHTQRYYDGLIDQVRIYDYARSPAQIAWEYNQGAPVAWYKFDEGEGTTAYDASGNGNNGTLTNMDPATDYVDGKINTALDFDGSDDYVEITNNDELNSKYITLSAWVKADAIGTHPRIIAKDSVTEDAGQSYQLILHSAGQIFFRGYAGNAWRGGDFETTFSQNGWEHVVATYDGEVFRVYVNGEQSPTTYNYVGALDTEDTDNLCIGSKCDNPTGYPFTGQIDDVRIYNYALTDYQVKQLYNQGVAVHFD
ncbi:hypothetical protein GF360_00005, partial [candidate division WWE3 bacterium]|nr:hypothetical protein [candidate division WWE3 bacterium]